MLYCCVFGAFNLAVPYPREYLDQVFQHKQHTRRLLLLAPISHFSTGLASQQTACSLISKRMRVLYPFHEGDDGIKSMVKRMSTI